MMRKAIAIAGAVILGGLTARIGGIALAAMLSDPHVQCINGALHVDRPIAAPLAEIDAQACRDQFDREGALRRFDAAHSWPFDAFARLAGFLVDPLNLGVTAVMALCFYPVTKRLTGLANRRARTEQA